MKVLQMYVSVLYTMVCAYDLYMCVVCVIFRNLRKGGGVKTKSIVDTTGRRKCVLISEVDLYT